MQRRAALRIAFLAVSFALAACGDDARSPRGEGTSSSGSTRPPKACDIWIRGGTVIDGTGAPARRADVLVTGERITWVGAVAADETRAKDVLDAAGLIVAPGFIDAHAHGDPVHESGFESFIAMGVTTICLGQDGASQGDRDPAAWLAKIDAARPAVNVCSLAGHGTLRRIAGIKDSPDPPDAAALERLANLVAEYLDAGYFGLSFGLEYTPGRFAGQPELVAAARPVARVDGVVAAHVRNEDSGAVIGAVREFLDAARSAGARAHVSHLKIVLGNDVVEADQLLTLLDGDGRENATITADLYPYRASYTGLAILFPDWARPPNAYAAVVKARRQDLLEHLERRVLARNGPEAMTFGSGALAGRSLADVARERSQPFSAVLLDLGPRGTSAAYFVMNAAVMKRLLRSPRVAVASDGSPTMRHPRGHGTFARVAGPMVRKGVLDLPTAIHKMTALPARIVGLPERGRLAIGAPADVVVFDAEQLVDLADFTDPHRQASGVRHVLVGGATACKDGAFRELRGGRALRRDR